MREGKKSCLDYAREKMGEILAAHKPMPLTSSLDEAIEGILTQARGYYRERGLISNEEWVVYMKSLKSPDYPYG